jgi:hypothetical protein
MLSGTDVFIMNIANSPENYSSGHLAKEIGSLREVSKRLNCRQEPTQIARACDGKVRSSGSLPEPFPTRVTLSWDSYLALQLRAFYFLTN